MKSKNKLQLLTWSLLIFTGVQFACSPSQTTTTTGANTENAYTSLIQLLRREPQLTISGPDSNPTITIRGNKSVTGSSEPLFVVNGTPLGYGYESASIIDAQEVKSIRVLPASQAGLYGSRGGGGVIQITTK